MADEPITTPAIHPGVTERTRRDALTALGATALAGIAVAGFARPEIVPGPTETSRRRDVVTDADAALFAACAAFQAAHAEQDRLNASQLRDDERTANVVNAWYDGVQALLVAPNPTTSAGRVALAAAAHVVLRDECGGSGSRPIEESTSVEQRVALKALAAASGAVS